MSAVSALGYLVVANARGRVRQLARRVRSPRHFFGMLAGAAWLLFLVSMNRKPMARLLEDPGAFGAARLVDLLAVGVLALYVLIAWVLVPEGNVLGFTEAEIHLLFAAPLRRRQLVAYKLARSALGALAMGVLISAIFGRGGAGDRAMLGVGAWVALLTLSLHAAGAALTRAALVQHGVSAVRRRMLTLAVAAAVPVAAVVGWRSAPPLDAFPPGVDGFAEWTRALLGTAPLSWVLYPLRLLLDAASATSGGAFLAALPGAAAVLALHVAWVFSSDTAFEELALGNAARLAARLEAARSGVIPMARRGGRRRSFTLRAGGRPESALAWKALVRGTRVVSIPLVATGLAFAIVLLAVVLASRGDGRGSSPVGAFVALVLFVMTVLFGSHAFSGDLRRDAPHLELLRALPLSGRQVLVGEIAAPFVTLAAMEGLLATLCYAFAAGAFPGSRADHAAFALAMAIGGPASSAVQFVLANGLVVLYPDWAGKPAGGASPLDRLGAQNLVGVVLAFATVAAIVPAALAGGVVAFVTWTALGTWAAPVGALAGAATIAIEAAVALRLLGRAFERIDASA